MSIAGRALIIILLALCLQGALTAAPAQAESLKFPPYRRVVLANGLTLLIMEKHEVPLVDLCIYIRAGSAADPRGKEGAASLAVELLRKGTAGRTAQQFAEEMDYLGGTFRTGISPDGAAITAGFMKKDLAEGLDLTVDALLHPAFTAGEFSKLLKQRIDGLKSARDSAQAVLGSYFNAFLYGSHPYGRPPGGDEASLARLTREDVQKSYDAFYGPGATVIAVVGDFAAADMEKLLTEKLGAWPAKNSPAVTVPPAVPIRGRRLLLVDKPDSTQTYFAIGNVGITRTNPDRVLVDIANTLFGGRYTSMLNTELRIKSGLTYGARSSFAEWMAGGPFSMRSYTRNAATAEALDKTLGVLKALHEKGISREDLDSARAYLKGQFPPTIETGAQLAATLSELVFHGLDEREVNTYFADLDAATPADMKRIITSYFPLDDLVFVLIGKASEVESAAAKYAPTVERKSISAPGF